MDYISVSPINPTSIFSFQNADLGVSSGRVIRPSGTHVALILRVRLTCVRAANVSEHFGARHHSECIPCVNTYDCLLPQRLKGVGSGLVGRKPGSVFESPHKSVAGLGSTLHHHTPVFSS